MPVLSLTRIQAIQSFTTKDSRNIQVYCIHRSSDVLVECGPEDALAAAEEVEICRYRLTLETPLACTEAALAEAGRRLEAFGGRDRSNGLKPETETDGESLPFGPDGGGGGGGGNGGGGDSGGGGERAVASGERDEL